MEAASPETGTRAPWFHATSHPDTSVSEVAGAQLMGPQRVLEAESPAGRSPPFHIMAVDISFMSTVRTWVTNDESSCHSECVENQVPCVMAAAFPYLSNSKLLRKRNSICFNHKLLISSLSLDISVNCTSMRLLGQGFSHFNSTGLNWGILKSSF